MDHSGTTQMVVTVYMTGMGSSLKHVDDGDVTLQCSRVHISKMTINCSICLTIFKEPSCLPCGHIYCSQCLSDHINALPNRGMTASCPECRTDFNIFTPELACLPKKYHRFILPSMRRVYMDLSACSVLQGKLEKAEARLKIHKNHEVALADRCESLSAALEAHRAGESEAVQIMRTEMAAYVESRREEVEQYDAKYRQLDQEHQLLQNRFLKIKRRYEQLNEQVARQAEEEPRVKRSGPSASPHRELAIELRAMKPLPKRRVFRRTRSNSPPPVYDAKRPRLSEGNRVIS